MGKVSPEIRNGQRPDASILFVGCDIGSKHHAAAIMDSSGTVLEKLPKVFNSLKGFEFLEGKINYWGRRTGADTIRLGFEPTGHYWKPLIHYMCCRGVEVSFIKTTAVKAMRELTDSTPSKNDKRDAVTLAHLLREGKVLKSPPVEGVWRELRDLVKHHRRLTEENGALLQRLRTIIDTFFPELTGAFCSNKAVGLWRLLEEAPFPEDLIARGPEWLSSNLKKWTRRGKGAEEKADLLMKAAAESVGLPVRHGDRVRLQSLLGLLVHYRGELASLEQEMERVLMETGYGEILLSFPGMGVITSATFLGELGNPANFENANQVVSFAGIDPSENSSGKKESRRKISKKGRPVMRANIYHMALAGIRHCPELKAYYAEHRSMIESGRLNLKPQQLLFAVAIKEVRMLFAMCRDERPYIPGYLQMKRAA
jgi:transposase